MAQDRRFSVLADIGFAPNSVSERDVLDGATSIRQHDLAVLGTQGHPSTPGSRWLLSRNYWRTEFPGEALSMQGLYP